MDSQAKRTFIAMMLCLAVVYGWLKLMEHMYPPIAAGPASQPASEPTPAADTVIAGGAPTSQLDRAAPPGRQEPLTVAPTEPPAILTLGDDRADDPAGKFRNPFHLRAEIDTRGAAIASVTLSRHRNRVAKDRRRPDHDPYRLLAPLGDPASGREYRSFALRSVRLVETKQVLDLENAVWSGRKTSDETGDSAALQLDVNDADRKVLRITRTYRLGRGAHHVECRMEVENLSAVPLTVVLNETGPVGMVNDDPQREYRRVVSAVVDAEGLAADGPTLTRAEVFKHPEAALELLPGEGRHLLWTATCNKYFACIAAPVTGRTPYADWLGKVTACALFSETEAVDDLTFAQVFRSPAPVAPGQRLSFQEDIFCVPKTSAVLENLPGAPRRNYLIVTHADRAPCTFQPLPSVMLWLLTRLYRLAGNYGVAIIILVIIVRLILHPVSKRGQVNMMKMQKSMAQLKPKIDALQQQYKNDRQKLNEEMMKLYRTEGINPATQMLGCLPLFLQMPIWVALWTTLNTNVDLRHAPFIWWINDLSAPDSLIPFDSAYSIPLINLMTGPIHAFNLLPIIMTLTMYLQQKLTQKLTRPTTPPPHPPPPVDAEGRPMPDQLAQQQKMMTFMTVFFGFLFYNFPSGLNLYILSSNLVGMLEQWQIRKHIRDKEARGELEVRRRPAKPAPRPAGSSWFERLQKRVDEARLARSDRAAAHKKRRKQPRF